MAAMSVIKKLQRCERIQGRDDYPVVKYKIKIKESASSSSSPSTISINSSCYLPLSAASCTRAFAELTDSLAHFAPPHEKFSTSLHQASGGAGFPRSPLNLQTESWQGRDADCKGISPYWCKLQLEVEEEEASSGGASKSPWKLELQDDTMAKDEDERRMVQGSEEEEGMWAMFPWKLEQQELAEEEAEEKYNEIGRRPASGEGNKLQAARRAVGKEVKKRDTMAAGRKVEKKEEQQGLKRKEWEVKRVQCECCGMEEECTRGYEERVRTELCGHWLCGLCAEAVREERQRLGGRAAGGEISLQAALQAHMQPCRRFSSRARAKASPPPSAVAVPHAVCRLLRRHLSTPSPSGGGRSELPRSSSCLPAFHQP